MRIRLESSSGSSTSSSPGKATDASNQKLSSPLGVDTPYESLALNDKHRNTDGSGRRQTHLDRINSIRSLSASYRTSRNHSLSPGISHPPWMGLEAHRPSASRSHTPKRHVSFVEDGNTFARERSDEDGSQESSSESLKSASDSEEEEWPVNASRKSKSQLMQKRRQPSIEALEITSRIRLGNEEESLYAPQRRNITPLQAIGGESLYIRRSQRATQPVVKQEDNDVDEVHHLLERMRIQKEKDEEKERSAFEERNKALWDAIEEGIKQAEEVRDRAVREEQERQQRAREEHEAEEKRAREAKEAEEKRKHEQDAREQEQKRQLEEKKAADEQERATKAQEKEAEESKARQMEEMGGSPLVSAGKEYEHWQKKMQHIKQHVLPTVSANAEWRKQCFTAKRSITRGISQLTNSRAEIIRITKSIGDVLTQAKSASPGGEIYTWILNHLSKCLIRQAEQEVAAKQDVAYPLARVVIWLLLDGHSELGDVLMARLSKKCCWCLGYCPPKTKSQDDASYAKQLGKSSVDEPTLQHTSRMSGIIALYFAICQTTLSSPPSSNTFDASQIPSHFRTGALWRWQARAMSPTLLEHALLPALWSVLIEVAGTIIIQAYGKQTSKIWRLLYHEGLQNGKAKFTTDQNANSAKVRLELLLENWSKSNQIETRTSGREMET